MDGTLLRDGKNLSTGYGRNQATSTTILLLFSESRFPFLKIPSATGAVFSLSFSFCFLYSFLFSWVMIIFYTLLEGVSEVFFLTKKEAYFSTSFCRFSVDIPSKGSLGFLLFKSNNSWLKYPFCHIKKRLSDEISDQDFTRLYTTKRYWDTPLHRHR